MSCITRTRAFRRASKVALCLAAVAMIAGPAVAKGKRVVNQPAVSATLSVPPTPAQFFTINSVLAKLEGRPVAGPMRFASAPGRMSDADGSLLAPVTDEPYGLAAFRAPEGPLWVKQRKLAADLAAEAADIAACRADAINCYAPAALRLISLAESARNLHGRTQLEAVNRGINDAVRYTSDLDQHGVADLWSAPLASLSSGRGDCEDYAIAKYAVLREAGFSEDDLRILLVRDRAVDQHHAVLAARLDGHWLVLDNRWSGAIEDHDLKRFVPLFSLDRRGVSLFATPFANRDWHADDVAPASPEADNMTAGGQNQLPLVM